MVLVSVYAIAGLTAGLGAIVQTGRLTGAGPQVDPNLLLTRDRGRADRRHGVHRRRRRAARHRDRRCSSSASIQNGLQLSNVSTFWQGTVSGLILICAVGLGVLATATRDVARAPPGPATAKRAGDRLHEARTCVRGPADANRSPDWREHEPFHHRAALAGPRDDALVRARSPAIGAGAGPRRSRSASRARSSRTRTSRRSPTARMLAAEHVRLEGQDHRREPLADKQVSDVDTFTTSR